MAPKLRRLTFRRAVQGTHRGADDGEINAFTGLTEVKQEIKSIIDSIKRQKKTQSGKPVQLKSHFVFTGNPEPERPLIAKLFADILGSLQCFQAAILVKVMGKDLVSQYVGDTALKTERVINSAMGGILFIDKAYSLKQGDDDKVGQEAIDPAAVPWRTGPETSSASSPATPRR